MPGLGIDAHHLVVFELGDERQRMTDCGQQDVPAGLVRLGLDREPQAVALIDGVLGEEIDPFPVPVKGSPDVLGEVDLGAFTAAPELVDLSTQLGSQIHIVHDLAQRIPAHATVVAGETAILEHRVPEQVGRHHWDDHAGVGQRFLELVDDPLPLGAARSWRDQIVVVEGDAVGAKTGRVASPNKSRACQPTVQRPKLNLSSRVGVTVTRLPLSCWR
jgi:hypothetical protein